MKRGRKPSKKEETTEFKTEKLLQKEQIQDAADLAVVKGITSSDFDSFQPSVVRPKLAIETPKSRKISKLESSTTTTTTSRQSPSSSQSPSASQSPSGSQSPSVSQSTSRTRFL